MSMIDRLTSLVAYDAYEVQDLVTQMEAEIDKLKEEISELKYEYEYARKHGFQE